MYLCVLISYRRSSFVGFKPAFLNNSDIVNLWFILKGREKIPSHFSEQNIFITINNRSITFQNIQFLRYFMGETIYDIKTLLSGFARLFCAKKRNRKSTISGNHGRRNGL